MFLPDIAKAGFLFSFLKEAAENPLPVMVFDDDLSLAVAKPIEKRALFLRHQNANGCR